MKQLLKEIKINKISIILIILSLFYLFIPEFIISTSLEYTIGIFVSIIILFFISHINKFIYVLIFSFSLFINAIIIHIILHWGTETVVSRIEVAALSPKSESREYLLTYLNTVDISVIFYFLIGILFLRYGYYKLFNSQKILQIVSTLLFIIFFSVLIIFQKADKILPYFYVDKYINIVEIKKINSRKEYLQNRNFISTIPNKILEYNKIIIVIGESVNKTHMGLYGYYKNTTPFLKELLKKQNTFKYNVIAATNQTRYSIPINLTDANVSNYDLFFYSESLLSTFKSLGYKTYWFSNQGSIGLNENSISTIANEADVVKMANVIYSDAKDDNILLDYLNKIDIDTSKNEVFFFHLMGSHGAYNKRYFYKNNELKNKIQIIEEYDNSIYHTDEILKKIYAKFKKEKLLFIYFSDHGEVVNSSKFGHGFNPAFKAEFDIPLFIHSTISNIKLKELYDWNQQVTYNMESFNHIVKYITNIEENSSNISTNSDVIVVTPNNIVKYESLKRNKVYD